MTTETIEDKIPETPPVETQKTPELTEQQKIDAAVDARLADIKEKLDKTFADRDAAIKEANELKAEKRQREIDDLKKAGDFKEAHEMELKEKERLLGLAEKRNIELTRDIDVKDALGDYKFKNARAKEIAVRGVIDQLIQDANGQWVTKTGKTIAEMAKIYAEDKDNSFLLEQKTSTGGGTTTVVETQTDKKPGSLFGMKQEDVLRMAEEGTLRKK